MSSSVMALWSRPTRRWSRSVSSTVGIMRPPVSERVESRLGSQPTCITSRPRSRRAMERLEETVLLPIPPLPYIAICRIYHLAL